MFDYLILAALAYFSYVYGSELLTLYKAGTAFSRADWLKFGLMIAMLVFFVIYVIKIIKNFKSKEQRQKEKAALQEKRAAMEAELHKKRMLQYMADYDDVTADSETGVIDAAEVTEVTEAVEEPAAVENPTATESKPE